MQGDLHDHCHFIRHCIEVVTSNANKIIQVFQLSVYLTLSQALKQTGALPRRCIRLVHLAWQEPGFFYFK